VTTLEAICHTFALGHAIQPVKLSTTVLATVESSEAIDTFFQLNEKAQLTNQRIPKKPRINTSLGRTNVKVCWNGHDPELRTWIEKSTKTKSKNKLKASVQIENIYKYLLSNCSLDWDKFFLNNSFKSLLTPISWNIRCNLEVYSKPHEC